MRNKISHKEVLEFTYDTLEERKKHVEEMIKNGWFVDSIIETRMKSDTSFGVAYNENNFEWYARFCKKY